VSARTPYVETEALLAVMEERDDDALAMLRDMMPGELKAFGHNASHLRSLISVVHEDQRRESAERAAAEAAGWTEGPDGWEP
jgi:hypothetical protein